MVGETAARVELFAGVELGALGLRIGFWCRPCYVARKSSGC